MGRYILNLNVLAINVSMIKNDFVIIDKRKILYLTLATYVSAAVNRKINTIFRNNGIYHISAHYCQVKRSMNFQFKQHYLQALEAIETISFGFHWSFRSIRTERKNSIGNSFYASVKIEDPCDP